MGADVCPITAFPLSVLIRFVWTCFFPYFDPQLGCILLDNHLYCYLQNEKELEKNWILKFCLLKINVRYINLHCSDFGEIWQIVWLLYYIFFYHLTSKFSHGCLKHMIPALGGIHSCISIVLKFRRHSMPM